jgi:hypothetical protein
MADDNQTIINIVDRRILDGLSSNDILDRTIQLTKDTVSIFSPFQQS